MEEKLVDFTSMSNGNNGEMSSEESDSDSSEEDCDDDQGYAGMFISCSTPCTPK